MAYSNHTIVCRFDSPWIEWKDILDALITLPEQDSNKSHDEMLQDIMKPNFRSGNLKKLGRVRKNWLERFFVLDFNTFYDHPKFSIIVQIPSVFVPFWYRISAGGAPYTRLCTFRPR